MAAIQPPGGIRGNERFLWNPLTLTFRDRELEQRFQEQFAEKFLFAFRLALVLGTVLYSGFLTLDYFIHPQYLASQAIIRLAVICPFYCLLYIISYARWFKKRAQTVIVIGILVSGCGHFAMAAMASLPETYVVMCTNLVLIFAYTFSGLRMVNAAYASWILIVIFELTAVYIEHHTAMAILYQSYFLLSTNLIGMLAGYTIERYTRIEFAQGLIIEEHAVDLAAANREAEEARAAAEKANRAKSTFLANMSHELRTPLNAIIGYGELLQEEAQDKGDDQLASDSRKIHIAGKHLLALINDVLDLSKIEAGRMELFLEDIDVPSMITDVVSTVEPLVQKRDNVLDVRCSPQVGSVHGDLIKTRQCLFNLLSNAAKFTEKGTVTLDASRCGDRIVFTVKDTGIGMTEDQMGRLFQSFSQGDSTIGSRFGGSGLGLAITRHFCDMMGGDINVASIPGEGSTFTLRLPAGAGADMPGREPEGEAVPSGEAGATVLVIDDDPAVRDLLKRTLTREGFRVECASGGEEGLTCARELHPDVITLDVLMPGADGWAVLAALKNDGATANIPVIMLSITDNKERGCTLGAAEYLYKPVDKETLIKAVRKYGGGGPMSVLIVEDDQTTRKLLRVTLEKEGWSVLEAEDGIAGLRRLEEIRPELILTDLMMPKMDGFEFVAELRRNESWKDIPVMVLTAKDLAAEERRQLEMSVGSVLQKGSYRREELLTEVRSLVTECVHKRR